MTDTWADLFERAEAYGTDVVAIREQLREVRGDD
ncbi:MAG: hypothetical protein ACI9YT_000453 [Halobacteriales archaeon]|jgi:hypothetical protein